MQKDTTKNVKTRKSTNNKFRLFPQKPLYIIALLLLALVAAAFFVMLIVANLLPSDLTVILAVTAIVMLIITSVMFASRKRWMRAVGIVVAVLFICMLGFVTNFMRNTYVMLNKIGIGTASAEASATESVTETPFNVYLTGIDQWEDEKGLDLERSDVNMILTVHPVTKKILLTSIPRDTYVMLHTAQQMDKLTHTGVYGVDETLNTVEDWLGIDLNYYVKMNFSGAKAIINAMDGIQVYSPVAFRSSLRGYKYVKGWNRLGGTKALYFARERKAFEGNDSIRVENQQRVIQAVIKKMTSHTSLLTKYGAIMEAAGDNVETNMAPSEMSELAKMQLAELCEWDIETQKVTGEYEMDYVASLTQDQKFLVYKADDKSVAECLDAIDKIMNPDPAEVEAIKKERSRSFVQSAINAAIERFRNGGSDEEDAE